MSGKTRRRGRPPEDRLLRQREIFLAVGPLIEERGPRITMRQVAEAARLSLGGLAHYFPTKRELLLHGLDPRALDRLCQDFLLEYGHLKERDPRGFVDAFVDSQIEHVLFIRPSFLVAMELGMETLWSSMKRSLDGTLEEFRQTLEEVLPFPQSRNLDVLTGAIRRVMVGSLFEPGVGFEDVRGQLKHLLDGTPLAVSQEAAS